MKTLSFLILNLCILSPVLTSCTKQETDDINKQVVFTKSEITLLNNSNKLGFDMLRQLSQNRSADQNLFISPLSISMALTMAFNGADGKTAKEMQTVLGLDGMSKEEVNEAYQHMMQIILNIDPKVTMEIANSIWYRNTFQVKTDFLKLNADYFSAEVRPVDYNNPATVTLINDWVKAKTHDKIQSIINELDPLEVMDIINAIYFKGNWTYKFDTKNTQKDPFHLSDGTTASVDFMAMKNTFRYMKNDLLAALELPYGDGGINMVLLLPNDGKSISDVVTEMTSQNWDAWTNKLDSTDVYLQLPKFKFSYENSLKDPLISLGMTSAFSASQANFSLITDNDLYISDVIHKTFVDVNEEGTEAAAVTIVRMMTTSMDGPAYTSFFANKPFVFVIRENSTNSIIFIGVVNKPVIEGV